MMSQECQGAGGLERPLPAGSPARWAAVRPGEVLLPRFESRAFADWVVVELDGDRCSLLPLGEVASLAGEVSVPVNDIVLTALVSSVVVVSATGLANSIHVGHVSRGQLAELQRASCQAGAVPAPTSFDPDDAQWREDVHADGRTLVRLYPAPPERVKSGVGWGTHVRRATALTLGVAATFALFWKPSVSADADLLRYQERGFSAYAVRLARGDIHCSALEVSRADQEVCRGPRSIEAYTSSGATLYLVQVDETGRRLSTEAVSLGPSDTWSAAGSIELQAQARRLWVVVQPEPVDPDPPSADPVVVQRDAVASHAVSAEQLDKIIATDGLERGRGLRVFSFNVRSH